MGKLTSLGLSQLRLHHLAASPLLTGVAEPYTMTLIEHIPVCHQPQRDPGPYELGRRCHACAAYLSRVNPGPLCSPCWTATLPAAERMDEAA